ncbi:unnamed protein product [Alternaria alternata]
MLDTLLSACKQTKAFAERENAVPLVQKFLVLAQTLESSKAVAFSLGIADSVEIAASTTAEKVAASLYSSPDVSLNAILATLGTLDVPPAPTIPKIGRCLLEERFETYKKDNWAHLPLEIKRMETDVYLEGTYPTAADFLNGVVLKARRDVHLPVGVKLFPQSPLDEISEEARKFIRDLPGDLISTRMAYYASALIDSAYTIGDLIPTANLHKFAELLERRCLELIGIGFIDDESRLSSMAALASAFGNAVDGLKEVQMVAEPWIEGLDLQTG